MWFIRFFIVLIGAGLIYMVVTQKTIPLSSGGRSISFTYSLWVDPVRFIVYFLAFAFFEWFLIRVHAGMMEEERGNRKRKRKKRSS